MPALHTAFGPWHLSLAQHGFPVTPQGTQSPSRQKASGTLQRNVPLQYPFSQHGWFSPPHATHMPLPLLHTPLLHAPLQQGCPGWPQRKHLLSALLQAVPAVEQCWFAQQGWPSPPQATQVLAAGLAPGTQSRSVLAQVPVPDVA